MLGCAMSVRCGTQGWQPGTLIASGSSERPGKPGPQLLTINQPFITCLGQETDAGLPGAQAGVWAVGAMGSCPRPVPTLFRLLLRPP